MLDTQLLLELEKYIEAHTSHRFFVLSEPVPSFGPEPELEISYQVISPELEDFVNRARKPTFNKVLFGFIDSKGTVDSDVYKRAGIDRRHFSKIRSSEDYKPGKRTVIALALALELDEDQMSELLSAAGYSLSDSDTFDLVIRFFLEREIYSIDDINLALHHFSLEPLV